MAPHVQFEDSASLCAAIHAVESSVLSSGSHGGARSAGAAFERAR
jgi:hypothetical protein